MMSLYDDPPLGVVARGDQIRVRLLHHDDDSPVGVVAHGRPDQGVCYVVMTYITI